MLMTSRVRRALVLATAAPLLFACGEPIDSTMPPVDPAPAGKGDAAHSCKPPVEAEPLSKPEITISIANPPMVRLRDLDTGVVKYYRAGVGVKKSGVSRSWEPVTHAGTNRFTINPQAPEAGCRTREWIDPHDHSNRSPLYAGLPWMPYRGYYAIHGPIDKYWNAQGGLLQPGYVSHGCVRMASYDIRELYGHIKHKTSVPLILTKDGFGDAAVQAAYHSGWVLDTCNEDHDCRAIGVGHYCRKAAGEAVGFCTQACSRYCPDRHGRPMTFCAADPTDGAGGYCVNRAADADQCDAGQSFTENVPRFGDPDYEPQGVCHPAFDVPAEDVTEPASDED